MKFRTHLSKQRSMLSDISSSIHNCSKAISCISLSSPCPILSHSSSVSGSTSTIFAENERQFEKQRIRKDDFDKEVSTWNRRHKSDRQKSFKVHFWVQCSFLVCELSFPVKSTAWSSAITVICVDKGRKKTRLIVSTSRHGNTSTDPFHSLASCLLIRRASLFLN